MPCQIAESMIYLAR